MTPDDDLLQRVHLEATRRIRRRRRVVTAATAAVVLLGASAAAAAVAGPDGSETVVATTPESTISTTNPTTTTTSEVTTTTSTTTTTPTTTTAPPTTTTAPPAPTVVTKTATDGDMTATVTASVDPTRPGFVTVTVRIQDPYGSEPWAWSEWEPGVNGEAFGDSVYVEYFPTSCDDAIDDDPTTNPGPDITAAPLDRTFTVTHDYGRVTGDAVMAITAITSTCTSDGNNSRIELVVPLAG